MLFFQFRAKRKKRSKHQHHRRGHMTGEDELTFNVCQDCPSCSCSYNTDTGLRYSSIGKPRDSTNLSPSEYTTTCTLDTSIHSDELQLSELCAEPLCTSSCGQGQVYTTLPCDDNICTCIQNQHFNQLSCDMLYREQKKHKRISGYNIAPCSEMETCLQSCSDYSNNHRIVDFKLEDVNNDNVDKKQDMDTHSGDSPDIIPLGSGLHD